VTLNIEASHASKAAEEAIKASGGTLTRVYFNKIGLTAHLKPHKFDVLPKSTGLPPRKKWHIYPEAAKGATQQAREAAIKAYENQPAPEWNKYGSLTIDVSQ
jgi:large subunit ribosomal protein L15